MLSSSKITVQASPGVSRFQRNTEIKLKSVGTRNPKKSQKMRKKRRRMTLLSIKMIF